MKELERQLKALANRRRLGILKHLKYNREDNVSNIAKAIKLSFKSTSHHLRLLSQTDILEKEQKNLFVFYRLTSERGPVLKALLAQL